MPISARFVKSSRRNCVNSAPDEQPANATIAEPANPTPLADANVGVSNRRVSAASEMSIDILSEPWWEDEANRGATALTILHSWLKDPQKMAEDPIVLALANPAFTTSSPAAKGYMVLREMLLRFDAKRDFDHRSDWEAVTAYLGADKPSVPVVFWSCETSFLACAANLSKLGLGTASQIVAETHSMRLNFDTIGFFVGHLSVRVGMDGADDAMEGYLRLYPDISPDVAFMSVLGDGTIIYPSLPTPSIGLDEPAPEQRLAPTTKTILVPASSSPAEWRTNQILQQAASTAPPAPVAVPQALRPVLTVQIPPWPVTSPPATAAWSPDVNYGTSEPQLSSLPTVLRSTPAPSADKPLPAHPSARDVFHPPPPSQPRSQPPMSPTQRRPQSPTSPRRNGRRHSVALEAGSSVAADFLAAYERNTRGHQRRRSYTTCAPTSPRAEPYSRPGSPLYASRVPCSPTRPTSPIRLPRSASRGASRPRSERADVVSYNDGDIPALPGGLPASAFLMPPFTQRNPTSSAVTTPYASSSPPRSPGVAAAPSNHAPLTSFAPAAMHITQAPLITTAQRRPPARRAPALAAQTRYPELPTRLWSPTGQRRSYWSRSRDNSRP